MRWLQKKAEKAAARAARKAAVRAARKARKVAAKAEKDTQADSGRPLEKPCNRFGDGARALFLRQSSRSNYCGVYSTGMLLSLLGLTTTRDRAFALFNLKRRNPDYPGASHSEIGKVFASAANVKSWRWEYHERFDFAAISQSLRAHLRISGGPTLLSFGAIHKNGVWRCTHLAVVVAATSELIGLLDPLGSKPRMPARANVWLRMAGGPRSVRVIGNSYSVSHESEAEVLRWTVT